MALDPEDVKDDLRAELFVLQSALKALQYPGLDELDKFLSLTYSESADSQIPKLRKQLDRTCGCYDPRHSIHTGETPRNKRDTCWSCPVHNICFNTGFNMQIWGIRYDCIISGNPVDISTYFMSWRQLASKAPRLIFATLIQFGNLAFFRHRIGNVCRLTVQLDYSVLDKSHQMTFGINLQGRL